jgi:DNA invertase Pin-like site-specific DNA recombinase
MRPTKAALYLRRSTNEVLQADSLNAQNELLRNYAAAQGMLVVASFEDSASGRTYKRDQFQALVDLVTSDRAEFEAILVRDVSRWGRFENSDEAAYYEFLCLSHGVRLVYVD